MHKIEGVLAPRSEWILLLLLVLFLGLGLSLSVVVPLGETPDELAHFSYMQFIARHGRLPVNPAERLEAGYRSDWPGLYQLLAAPLVKAADVMMPTSPGDPTELRVISANPRRLLPLDGYGGTVVLHTDDELSPYRGFILGWHVARIVSVLLNTGALLLIFVTLRQQFPEPASLLATTVVGLIPMFAVIGSVLNDDSLLGFLVALFLWLLWPLFKREGGTGRYLALGVVAGLAVVTKYSTVFLFLDLVFLHVLLRRRIAVRQGIAFIGGFVLSSGWWFGFVLYCFNQVETRGWFNGLLAPFLSGGTDVATRRIATFLGADSLTTPLASTVSTDLFQWLQALFVSFWFPNLVELWWWLPLVLVTVLLFVGIARAWRQRLVDRKIILFCVGHILLFFPLPLARFVLTQNLAETAQGRHILIPTLLPLAVLILTGLKGLLPRRSLAWGLAGLALFLGVGFAVAVWPAVTLAHVPYFPVRTRLAAAPQVAVNASYRGEIALVGTDIPRAGYQGHAIPLTLIWEAKEVPAVDYAVRVAVLDRDGRLAGLWRGQPVNGRYPTRAWEPGDVVYHAVWVPVLPGTLLGEYALAVQVLDDAGRPVPADETGQETLTLGTVAIPANASPDGVYLIPRGDRFATTDPYRGRSTIAMIASPAPGAETATLRGPDDALHAPAETLVNDEDLILLFAVEWSWPTGDYALVWLDDAGQPVQTTERVAWVQNNYRPTVPPAISRPLDARFGDELVLLGYDLPRNRVQPGQSFDITLYWQCQRVTNVDYAVFNHLLDANQVQRGGRDRTPQNFYSTILWQPGEVVTDRYAVPVDADAPPGIYWLDVGLYPTNVPAGDASAATGSVRLGPVKVGGQPAASIPRATPQIARDDRFGNRDGGIIALSGYTMRVDPARHALHVDITWTALATPPRDYTVFVHVVDPAGAPVAQHDGPPVDGRYPTSLWDVGDQVWDQRQVSLDGVPAGTYTVRVGWYDPASGQRLAVPGNPAGFVVLGTFEVP